MSTKLYVGNLSWDTKADDLYALFGKFGTVVSWKPLLRTSGAGTRCLLDLPCPVLECGSSSLAACLVSCPSFVQKPPAPPDIKVTNCPLVAGGRLRAH